MTSSNTFRNGTVKISNDILLLIASIAAQEVEGVYGLVGKSEGKDKRTKETIKGVSMNIEGQEISISLNAIFNEGVRILEVAQNVQENVKKQIEIMTGLSVVKVDVNVENLHQKA